MKTYLALLFSLTFLAVGTPAPTARADVSVSIGFFYDALDPYGDWLYTPSYGYVWQPTAARQPTWAPYADGYWAYTDAGWTWISYEDFGWATYHYGRWIRMNSRWCWVPGYEWAPAWVSWRQADDYVGWAPLPPEARWFFNIGFSSWTDSHYDIGPACYNFIPYRHFTARSSLSPFILDRSRNITYVDRSINITNITYRDSVVNNIFVGGPDPSRMDRLGGSPVRRLSLRRDEDTFRREWIGRGNNAPRPQNFRSLSRIENGQLLVAAPSIQRDATPTLPSRVRERFERPEIDRGWRGFGDNNNNSKTLERLRTRQQEELARFSPDKMPGKAPLIVTSKTPPPQISRTSPRDRDGRAPDEEVRKAQTIPQPGNRIQDQPPKTIPKLPGRDGPPGRDAMPGRDGPPSRTMPGGSIPRPEPQRIQPPKPTTPPKAPPVQPPKVEPQRLPPSGGRAPLPSTRPVPTQPMPDMPKMPKRTSVPPPSVKPPEVRRSVPPPNVKPPEVRRSVPPPSVKPPEVRRMPSPPAVPRLSPPTQPKAMPSPRPAPKLTPTPSLPKSKPPGPARAPEERRKR